MVDQTTPGVSTAKHVLFSTILIAISIVVALAVGEFAVRLKNSSMRNYDIEMWRYSKELKVHSDDKALDFVHAKGREAVLQSVLVRLNEVGLRGGPLNPSFKGRRILLLGGSITLGWGVPEKETVSGRLQQMFDASGSPVEVLNGGVGNYNAERYVSRFFQELETVKPTDIVVHYFLRDAEELPPGGGNFLLRHSELAVTAWIAYHRLFDKTGEQSLVDHYNAVYQTQAPGFQVMREHLKRLSAYGKANHIRIVMAMVPDVHNLVDYKFRPIHEQMKGVAQELGWEFVDLLPALEGRPPAELWAMPGDPHPNSLGHKLMADAMFPVLAKPAAH
jgi:lysophospholipase L1-like esterase